MRRLCLSSAFLLGALSAAHAFKGECVLQVKDVTYLDGPCEISMEAGGNFQVSTLTGRLYFAAFFPEGGGTATASWNGTIPGATHAHTDLGNLSRQGACWVNEQAKVCAWRPGTRRR